MSEALGLGKIIATPQKRDAIHVAVIPVIVSYGCPPSGLKPGTHVGVRHENGTCYVDPHGKPVGIIDPYLLVPVQSSQECWLFLYPGSVTSLRHAWTHPAFEEEKSV